MLHCEVHVEGGRPGERRRGAFAAPPGEAFVFDQDPLFRIIFMIPARSSWASRS